MKKRLLSTAVATALVLCIGMAPAGASESGAVAISELYPLIMKGEQNPELKADLVAFFENNFSDLIADIENSVTRREMPTVADFLRAEFAHYADVLPMKRAQPGELNNWVAFKQKDYQCLILGRKIKRLKKSHEKKETIQQHEARLRSLLAQLLEIKLTKERNDIDELEKRLEELKNIHHIRTNNQKKILQKRYDELVGDQLLFQW